MLCCPSTPVLYQMSKPSPDTWWGLSLSAFPSHLQSISLIVFLAFPILSAPSLFLVFSHSFPSPVLMRLTSSAPHPLFSLFWVCCFPISCFISISALTCHVLLFITSCCPCFLPLTVCPIPDMFTCFQYAYLPCIYSLCAPCCLYQFVCFPSSVLCLSLVPCPLFMFNLCLLPVSLCFPGLFCTWFAFVFRFLEFWYLPFVSSIFVIYGFGL